MIPTLPPPIPRGRGSSPQEDEERKREREAEARRLQRIARHRRSILRLGISVGFDAYFAFGVAMTRSLLSLGLFIFSIVITVWTIRDVLRARREFAVAGP